MNPVERVQSNPVNAHMVRAALEREVAEAHVLSAPVSARVVADQVSARVRPRRSVWVRLRRLLGGV